MESPIYPMWAGEAQGRAGHSRIFGKFSINNTEITADGEGNVTDRYCVINEHTVMRK